MYIKVGFKGGQSYIGMFSWWQILITPFFSRAFGWNIFIGTKFVNQWKSKTQLLLRSLTHKDSELLDWSVNNSRVTAYRLITIAVTYLESLQCVVSMRFLLIASKISEKYGNRSPWNYEIQLNETNGTGLTLMVSVFFVINIGDPSINAQGTH